MNEKYLYFRKGPGLSDDDDSSNSCCFPLSSLTSMVPALDGVLQLNFKSMANHDGFTHGANDVVVSDYISLSIGANTHKAVMESLTEKFSSPQRDGILVIGDVVTGEFCTPLISAVSGITISSTLT